MELYINYLHRELTQRQNRTRTTVNDRQHVFDEYKFKINFDGSQNFGIENQENVTGIFKQKVKDAIIEIYRSHGEDRINRLAFQGNEESPANCIAYRFGDEDENYGESVYTLLHGQGWKYYNLPPFGINVGNSNLIDPRTIIDGLLGTEEIGDYIDSFTIEYVETTWEFINPRKDENNIKADKINILSDLITFEIKEPVFAFPYPDSLEDGEVNEQCTDFTTPFALVLKGEYGNENEILTLDFKLRRIYNSDGEILNVLSGSASASEISLLDDCFDENGRQQMGTDVFYNYEGDFCTNRIKTDSTLTKNFDDNLMPFGLLMLYPLNANLEINECYVENTEYLSVYSDIEKLNDENAPVSCEKFGFAVPNYQDDYNYVEYYDECEIVKKSCIRYSQLLSFRTITGIRDFEAQLFGSSKIKDCTLEYYDADEDGNENWTVRYIIKNSEVSVYYASGKNRKDGVDAKRIVFESFAGGKTAAKEELKTIPSAVCDLYVKNNTILEIRDIHVNLDIIKIALFRRIKGEIQNIETASEVTSYFEKDLISKIEEFEKGQNKKKKIIIVNSQAGRKAAPVPKKAENKQRVKVLSKIEENKDFSEEGKSPKLSALDFYLSTDKEKTLYYSENMLNEIALSLTAWIPVMEAARKEGSTVRQFMEDRLKNGKRGKNPFPDIPNLAIMGEAGTGKTTIARKLAKDCLGAEFKEITGSNLKSFYIGGEKLIFGKLIYEVQKAKNDDIPAVIFLDEAYTVFESVTNGEKYTGDVINSILKMTEEGEYEFDLSEFGDEKLKAAGLFFLKDELDGYEDENLYEHKWAGTVYEIKVRKVIKRANTVLWLGGYEDRLRKSLAANEGLSRRFLSKISIPSPRMSELINLFKDSIVDNGTLSGKSEKEVRNFLTWATSRSRSHLFGNFAGVKELIRRYKNSYFLCEDIDVACENAISKYKVEIEKQYKTEILQEIPELPFEVVTEMDVTLDDYAGNDNLKSRIKSIIDIMLHNEDYKEMNISLPKGALLMGPPGTGKTMVAKCMAGELQIRINEEALEKNQKDVAFIPTSAAEILATPNPVKVISALFSEAAAYDAAVIFIDEIDAIGKRRELQSNIGPLTQLMKEMDGFASNGNIFVAAATNDPDVLDPALIRDNRLDIRLEIGIPDKNTSISLIKYYLKEYGIDYDNLSDELKRRTLNYLGGRVPAFVKANLNGAAILYHQSEKLLARFSDEEIEKNYEMELIHRKKNDDTYLRSEGYDGTGIADYEVFLTDLKETIDIKEMGTRNEIDDEKEEVFNTDPDSNGSQSSVAIHEVGHALVGLKLGISDIERITILGRGNAEGYVEHKRNKNTFDNTKKGFLNRIMISMGGRVAEELIYGPDNISSGASSDIQKAGHLARIMVNIYGFSDEIGFMGIEKVKMGYLGTTFESNVSESLLDLAEKEQSRILKECMEQTRKILSENKELLLEISRELFELKEISGEQMEEIYMKYN